MTCMLNESILAKSCQVHMFYNVIAYVMLERYDTSTVLKLRMDFCNQGTSLHKFSLHVKFPLSFLTGWSQIIYFRDPPQRSLLFL